MQQSPGESSAWIASLPRRSGSRIRGVVALELGGNGPGPRPGVVESLGVDLAAGQRPQVTVPAGLWQRTLPSDTDALVSCIVSPGFDFEGFELFPGAP